MVYRIYVEKKKEQANEAKALLADLRALLGIGTLEGLRILNRYDVENIDAELFETAKNTVFSEPQLDLVTDEIAVGDNRVFAVEYLPGQFDQRADSAAQCIQIISRGERPLVRTAKVYLLDGRISDGEFSRIKKYIINPVEAREAALECQTTLKTQYSIPKEVAILSGFLKMDDAALGNFIAEKGLAMDLDDIRFCQSYFQTEKREPTITEIRMIDTYWSDHCRHTTFLTTIDEVKFEDALLEEAYRDYLATREQLGRTKPVNLMDIATLAAKYLKKIGKLDKLDESEEINACTVKINVTADGKTEPWLLLFKNETHNHPTEIEPFGGAATCIGGAIRDPLSGRAYVYGAMRVTGAANPLADVAETLPGKLPQRKIVTTAAAGYSSYGNQIGLATGQVDEIYHPGYAAKRMEIGAVIGAAPEANVRRETPTPGDAIILLGGRTGRDGCGGATGSSKSHNLKSLENCGAEVQKGNAPEERKLQRLFRNPAASRLIKRCNDFGAGGVSVAIGELADGIDIELDRVPKKYDGLDGTELAISESQERMAVVVAEADAERFLSLADGENLEATVVARVKADKRLTMYWNGKKIVDVSREFLNSNGAEKHIRVAPAKPEKFGKEIGADFEKEYFSLVGDLNICSKRGLSERFDSTIGAGTVLMPFGGKNQLTPPQAMVQKISMEQKSTNDCSLMSWGFNPRIAEKSPYHAAFLAVVESAAKLVATGAEFREVYLTFQEYFEKPAKDPKRWGKPLAALLGAFEAQKKLGIGAIGGKDSMSGSFEKLDVPPTLVSFAVTTAKTESILSPEFKGAGHSVVLLKPETDENGLPVAESLIKNFALVHSLIQSGKALAVYSPVSGGIAEAVFKMAIGNGIGFCFDDKRTMAELFGYCYGSFVIELAGAAGDFTLLGKTASAREISLGEKKIPLDALLAEYEGKLESIYPCNIAHKKTEIPSLRHEKSSGVVPAVRTARPRVLIPVFPGTNCEYDSARAVAAAGGEPQIRVINNLTSAGIARSVESFAKEVKNAQMIFIPGGFSGGDEPDGSGKFITAFFRNLAVKDSVTDLLDRNGGLICGICNGFQALIKLGLVPYGKICEPDEDAPTLTFNTIGRHQSRIARTRVASTLSPFLSEMKVGDVVCVPISHGEGRFIASDEWLDRLAKNGQIATQYCDAEGNPSAEVAFNPNDSMLAIEGITSPDGRVLGKMGHSERIGNGLYRNIPGNFDIGLFRSAVKYFKS